MILADISLYSGGGGGGYFQIFRPLLYREIRMAETLLSAGVLLRQSSHEANRVQKPINQTNPCDEQ
jgi:hypothetical protein